MIDSYSQPSQSIFKIEPSGISYLFIISSNVSSGTVIPSSDLKVGLKNTIDWFRAQN